MTANEDVFVALRRLRPGIERADNIQIIHEKCASFKFLSDVPKWIVEIGKLGKGGAQEALAGLDREASDVFGQEALTGDRAGSGIDRCGKDRRAVDREHQFHNG